MLEFYVAVIVARTKTRLEKSSRRVCQLDRAATPKLLIGSCRVLKR